MATFKNLIPYFEISLCANKKSYNNYDDPKHLGRQLFHLKVTGNGRKLAYIKGSLPF